MSLTADRDTQRRDSVDFAPPCAATKTFYTGAIVFLDSSGNAEPATAAVGKTCAGIAQESKTSTTAAAERIKVLTNRAFKLVNGESITKADVGKPCYADDDQTVMLSNSGRSLVGTIVDVDTDGVWVFIPSPSLSGRKRYLNVRATDVVGANAKRYLTVAPAAGKITKVWSVLSGAALTTGDCTLTGKINTVAITSGALTITQSGSAIGDVDSATPSAANTVAPGDVIEFLVGGTNAQTAAWAEITIELSLS